MSESDRGRRPSERGVPLVRLKPIRHARGLSQRRLESLSGVSDSTISEIERFEKRASPETVRCLARGLGVREAQLVGRGGSWLPRLPLESSALTVRWYERASNARARLKARAGRAGSGDTRR